MLQQRKGLPIPPFQLEQNWKMQSNCWILPKTLSVGWDNAQWYDLKRFCPVVKGQIMSKGLLVSSNSPKKRTNEFVFTTMKNSFVRFLGEFEDTKKSFRNYLTFNSRKFSKKSQFWTFRDLANSIFLNQWHQRILNSKIFNRSEYLNLFRG